MTPRLQMLRKWLQAHACSDETELRHRTRMLQLLHSRGDPCARNHFSPGHFTASGFVLCPAGDALLLVLHSKLKRWLQPGGHIESGDADLATAARREVAEETGVRALIPAHDGIFDLDVHELPRLGDEPPHLHFDVRFLFRAPSERLGQSDEVDAARFVPLRELRLQADRNDADASVMRVVRKLEVGNGFV